MERPGTKTPNLLSALNSLSGQKEDLSFYPPDSYESDWTISGATSNITASKWINPLYYSIEVQPNDISNTVTFELSGVQVTDDDLINGQVQFHSRFYSEHDILMSTQIENVTTSETSDEAAFSAVGNLWSTAWSPVIDFGASNTAEFNIVISITNHGGNKFWMTLPHLINNAGFYRNMWIFNSRKFLPTVLWDRDMVQEFPSYPFHRLFHALTSAAGESINIAYAIARYTNKQISPLSTIGNARYSELVDINYMDVDNANWAAQFTGSKIIKSVTATVQDAFVIGSPTKGQLSDDPEYQYELGPESTSQELINDVNKFIRWQLRNAYFGRNAGTTQAIRESVQQILTGNKTVWIFPGGSSFTINIYTLTGETVGVDTEGDSSDAVLKIANLAKPLGFQLNHASYDQLPVILDDPIYGELLPDGTPLG